MPDSLRHPLILQVAARLALALLVMLFATIALALWFYAQANQRSLEHHLLQAEKHFNGALVLRESEWERDAYSFRARLEYSRVLEDATMRQSRLGTFIIAQGGVPEYPIVVVIDREGTRLAVFSYAHDSMPSPVFDGGDAGWAYDAAGNRLYRVFRQQIWLGAGQNGSLLTYRRIDHAFLGTLTYPETDLVALWKKRPVASSLGDDGMKVSDDDMALVAAPHSMLLPWNPARPDNPRVLLRIHPNEPFALRELFQPLILGALAFAAAAWMVFGIWVTGLVRRILALGAAQKEFAEVGTVSPLVIKQLNRAEPQRSDELGRLSGSLLELMGSLAEQRRAQDHVAEVLRLNEERYRFLVEGIEVVAWEFSTAEESFTYVSPRAADLLGYELADWRQPNFLQMHAHPDDLPRVREARIKAIEKGEACALDYRLRHRDGHFVWVHHLSGAHLAADPLPRTMVRGMLFDISERKRIEQRLALAGQVFETASEGIMLTDAQNRIISVNPAFEVITGYPAAEVIGRDPKFLNAGLQGPDYYQAMWHGLQRDGRWEGEVWNRRKSGEPFAQRLSVTIIRDEWGHIKRHLAMFSDVTTQKRQAEEIEHQAGHDSLTGLPNRRLLADRMSQAIARAQRQSSQVGIMMLDLDGFKHINDTLGHRLGDLLLIETARRLVHCVRESDTVARVGGDEFMVVLPEIQSQNDLQTLATKINGHISEPFAIEGKDLFVSCSVGLTLFPDDGMDAGVLLTNADTAMYRAKSEGKNTSRFFTQDMQQHALERLRLENGLRRALRDGEFVLYYQPVIDLSNGALVKAEALIRWRDPERGLLEPTEFIPVAEDTGLIVPIGAWVLQAAVRQAAQWKTPAPPGFRVGINLSAPQFQRGDCAALLCDVLAAEGASPDQLVVEITESVFIGDKGDARRQLTEMKNLGIQVAIDDFGTGFSSLSYLKHFPIDTLKIDQSFVNGIPDDAEDIALIEAMISMSRALGLAVIAEGIETEAQRSFLIGSGCRYGQGYLIGRPCPAGEFAERYLRNPISAAA
jgi:diguanylate cyclase (GGDEF)-like protein/PAS domain S-box-containing protein